MLVRPGDLLVSLTRPTRRAIAFMPEDLPLAVASNGFAVLRHPNESKITRRFLFHILRSRLCTAQFDRRSSGGNYPAITEDQLLELVIPLPQPERQNRIGALLDLQYQRAEELLASADEEMKAVRRYIEELILGKGART